MENSEIAWTTHTFNPWIGCQRVSPGCENCYAETQNKRWGHDNWGPKAPRRKMSAAYWLKPLKWNEAAKNAKVISLAGGVHECPPPTFVFCASMADVFEDRPELEEWRAELWDLIVATPYLTWQLLTKRPENIVRMMPDRWITGIPQNIWIGATAENQQQLEKRIEYLAVLNCTRFISCEPLIGPIHDIGIDVSDGSAFVEWVIVGAESGHGARPMRLEWARWLRDQARDRGAAFFMKQVCDERGRKLPYTSIPADLQIREFPKELLF